MHHLWRHAENTLKRQHDEIIAAAEGDKASAVELEAIEAAIKSKIDALDKIDFGTPTAGVGGAAAPGFAIGEGSDKITPISTKERKKLYEIIAGEPLPTDADIKKFEVDSGYKIPDRCHEQSGYSRRRQKRFLFVC